MPDLSAVTELDHLATAAREARRPHEGQWQINLAMYLGMQWSLWDGRGLYEPELEPWQVKIVDNRIQPVVRVDIAKMTKTRPTFVGVPKNTNDEAVAAARLTERGLDFQWQELDLQRKLRQALLWSRVCSAGFWKICWDKGAGRKAKVLAGPDGQTLRDQNGSVMTPARAQTLPAEMLAGVTTKEVAMGDILCEVRSPFQIFPDPIVSEEGLEAAEWVIEESVQSLDYVRSRFDVDIAEGDASTFTGDMGLTLPGRIGEKGAQGYRGVRVREMWCKPSVEHPNGKRVVWAQNAILDESDQPYPWLPYVMFRGTPVPGRFWPDAIVTQLVSPQVELNKRKSMIAENAMRIGNPPLLVPEGSDYEYSGLPGGELRYQVTGSPSDVPSFLQPPEMPGYIREDIARIEASMQEISGQHDVSHGAVPSGVTAASAINLLQEADDTRLGPDIADMERSLADAGKRIVWLMQHYYTDERMIRLAGEDGAWDIEPFRGKQLEGNDDVQVQAGSAMPRSKAAKQAAIQEVLNLALQYGVPLKEGDLRRTLQEYEVGGVERLFGDLGVDERHVNRENMMLAQGEGFDINAFDNDEAHISGHERFQKSAAYARMEDPVRQNFDAHVDAHRQRQAMMAPPLDPMQPPSGPSGPTPPVPSPPSQ